MKNRRVKVNDSYSIINKSYSTSVAQKGYTPNIINGTFAKLCGNDTKLVPKLPRNYSSVTCKKK